MYPKYREATIRLGVIGIYTASAYCLLIVHGQTSLIFLGVVFLLGGYLFNSWHAATLACLLLGAIKGSGYLVTLPLVGPIIKSGLQGFDDFKEEFLWNRSQAKEPPEPSAMYAEGSHTNRRMHRGATNGSGKGNSTHERNNNQHKHMSRSQHEMDEVTRLYNGLNLNKRLNRPGGPSRAQYDIRSPPMPHNFALYDSDEVSDDDSDEEAQPTFNYQNRQYPFNYQVPFQQQPQYNYQVPPPPQQPQYNYNYQVPPQQPQYNYTYQVPPQPFYIYQMPPQHPPCHIHEYESDSDSASNTSSDSESDHHDYELVEPPYSHFGHPPSSRPEHCANHHIHHHHDPHIHHDPHVHHDHIHHDPHVHHDHIHHDHHNIHHIGHHDCHNVQPGNYTIDSHGHHHNSHLPIYAMGQPGPLPTRWPDHHGHGHLDRWDNTANPPHS
ncbi:hypothetical protein NEHOM01_2094 [Nematocida homosporus]|uniref:uncharacterized protein n=1 Tax=Nematocida homosporus TaxID=1912981 RepID=UPI002220FC50|nr:uncharacterized protein NEHOM01_2094 [Nematocida homosporus]KAI5187327.1 hypothetical protein NEHOM01_2094 [Nematocida homosporus]